MNYHSSAWQLAVLLAVLSCRGSESVGPHTTTTRVRTAEQPTHTVTVSVRGGTVRIAANRQCSGTCKFTIGHGRTIVLSPTKADRCTEVRWSGCDELEAERCLVEVRAAITVDAEYHPVGPSVAWAHEMPESWPTRISALEYAGTIVAVGGLGGPLKTGRPSVTPRARTGYVAALNFLDGAPVWRRGFSDGAGEVSVHSLAASGGKIVALLSFSRKLVSKGLLLRSPGRGVAVVGLAQKTGDLKWARVISAAKYARSIATDPSGNAYVAYSTSLASRRILVQQFLPNGRLGWSTVVLRRPVIMQSPPLVRVARDRLILASHERAPNAPDGVIAVSAVDLQTGQVMWTTTIPFLDFGIVHALGINRTGSIVVSGEFGPTIGGKPGVDSEGKSDLFIATVSLEGTLQGLVRAGGADWDAPGGVVFSGSSRYLAGLTQGGMSFAATVLPRHRKFLVELRPDGTSRTVLSWVGKRPPPMAIAAGKKSLLLASERLRHELELGPRVVLRGPPAAFVARLDRCSATRK